MSSRQRERKLLLPWIRMAKLLSKGFTFPLFLHQLSMSAKDTISHFVFYLPASANHLVSSWITALGWPTVPFWGTMVKRSGRWGKEGEAEITDRLPVNDNGCLPALCFSVSPYTCDLVFLNEGLCYTYSQHVWSVFCVLLSMLDALYKLI